MAAGDRQLAVSGVNAALADRWLGKPTTPDKDGNNRQWVAEDNGDGTYDIYLVTDG